MNIENLFEKDLTDPFQLHLDERAKYSYYDEWLDRETFDKLVSIYPKFDRWIVETYVRILKETQDDERERQRVVDLFWEDEHFLKKYLIIFEKAKNKKWLSSRDTDLMRLKTTGELKNLVMPFWDDVFSAEDEEEGGKADKIYDKDEWLVVIPRDQEASCKYGANTQWCTASRTSSNYFDRYNNDGPLYIIIDRRSNRKWQFHPATDTFMDERDDEASFNDYAGFPSDLQHFLEERDIVPSEFVLLRDLKDDIDISVDEWIKRYASELNLYKEDLYEILIGSEYIDVVTLLNQNGLNEIRDAVAAELDPSYFDDALLYGRDNPELFLDEEPEDEDALGEPIWSEDQRDEAGQRAYERAEEDAYNERVDSILSTDLGDVRAEHGPEFSMIVSDPQYWDMQAFWAEVKNWISRKTKAGSFDSVVHDLEDILY